MPVQNYSTTASDNSSSPPNGWPENMAAAAVNNCARQMMADIAIEAQVNRVKYVNSVAGTNTITGSLTPALTAYSAGMILVLTPAGNNTGATTLNINSLGALDILKADGDALASGDLVAGVPAYCVLDSGADDWYLLNPQSLTLANASFSGTLSVTGALTLNGALTTDNTTADEPGFKGLPQNSQSGDYTAVLADAGRHIFAGGGVSTITIPANSSVAYPTGTVLTIVNASGSNISIAITTDTMTLSATTTTGTRTLANNGIATAIKYGSTSWVITGTGLS